MRPTAYVTVPTTETATATTAAQRSHRATLASGPGFIADGSCTTGFLHDVAARRELRRSGRVVARAMRVLRLVGAVAALCSVAGVSRADSLRGTTGEVTDRSVTVDARIDRGD